MAKRSLTTRVSGPRSLGPSAADELRGHAPAAGGGRLAGPATPPCAGFGTRPVTPSRSLSLKSGTGLNEVLRAVLSVSTGRTIRVGGRGVGTVDRTGGWRMTVSAAPPAGRYPSHQRGPAPSFRAAGIGTSFPRRGLQLQHRQLQCFSRSRGSDSGSQRQESRRGPPARPQRRPLRSSSACSPRSYQRHHSAPSSDSRATACPHGARMPYASAPQALGTPPSPVLRAPNTGFARNQRRNIQACILYRDETPQRERPCSLELIPGAAVESAIANTPPRGCAHTHADEAKKKGDEGPHRHVTDPVEAAPLATVVG